MTPNQQPAREWRPQSYNQKQLDSANNLNELGSKFLYRASSLANPLISAFEIDLFPQTTPGSVKSSQETEQLFKHTEFNINNC